MTDDDEICWLDAPTVMALDGWTQVLSPLGANLLVRTDSGAWSLCTDWTLLNSGRGALHLTDPVDYFGELALSSSPSGLVAELYGSARRWDDFSRLLLQDPATRAHILRVPGHVFQADLQDWELIDKCVDTARLLEARDQARRAALEVVDGLTADQVPSGAGGADDPHLPG